MSFHLPRPSSTPPCMPSATNSDYPDHVYAHYFETLSEPSREPIATTEATSLSERELCLAHEFASRSRVLAWRRNIPDTDLSECGIGIPGLLDFRWPEPDHATVAATTNLTDNTDDATLEEMLHSPTLARHIGPSGAIRLYSLDDIYREARIPPLVIGQDDIVGDRRLVTNRDGFLYHDPDIASLVDVIATRGLLTGPDDPRFEMEAFYYDHAVRVFSQVPIIEEVEGVKEPQFEWIGDCYIMKTSRYLCKEGWAKVNQQTKEFLTARRALVIVAPPEDPVPGRPYTRTNVGRSYNHGNVFPLIVLRQTFRGRLGDYYFEGSPPVVPPNSPSDSVPGFSDSSPYEASDGGSESPNEGPKSVCEGLTPTRSPGSSSTCYTV